MKINRRKLLSLLGVSPALLAGSRLEAGQKKKGAHGAGSEPKLTAVSPKGTPPAIQLYAMAPRASSLDGKTIYVVDATSFDGSETLLRKYAGLVRAEHADREDRLPKEVRCLRHGRSEALVGD